MAELRSDARLADLARKNLDTWARQNIAPLPDIADMARRERARTDFRFFCETYFTGAVFRDWSDDHLRVIGKIEKAVRDGGLFAFAMPRGSGKTTLARLSALWAVLSGHRPFVCLIGGSQERAVELLAPIRKAVLENPLLLADFPTAVYPLKQLQNNARRQIGQHIDGRPTYCTWAADKLVFPTIDGPHNEASGAIITVTSLDANMRGQQHTRMDGRTIRPSFVLLDDPQTRQSARSVTQTRYRLQLLMGDVLGMAGPGELIAGVMTCTTIYPDDLVDQLFVRDDYPEWESECTKLVYSFPTNTELWDQYYALCQSEDHSIATEFYREHREKMDEGANVAWIERYNAETEISAVQHAMNLKRKVGEEAFVAEYQNEPIVESLDHSELPSVADICAHLNGHPRGEVPLRASHLTMFVDVHDALLYWCVCAWETNFTGYIVDYGTYPDQRRAWFSLRDARNTLAYVASGHGKDEAIRLGLEELVVAQLEREWQRGDGAMLQVGKCLIDSGYAEDTVYLVTRRLKRMQTVQPARGIGITADRKPFSEYTKRPGDQVGFHWRIPTVRKTRGVPTVTMDVNFWKSFVAMRLCVGLSEKGSLSLFGASRDDGARHRLFAEHLTSEYAIRTEGRGRCVDVWKPRPNMPDNHWWDCLVGCTVGASMLGCSLPGLSVVIEERRKYQHSDFGRGYVRSNVEPVMSSSGRKRYRQDDFVR